MKKSMLLLCIFFGFQTIISQTKKEQKDSLQVYETKEVIVIGNKRKEIDHKKHIKPLSTLDQFLEESLKITMIKRGNYAWEPTLNNMVSDRLNVTIDGMQIFGACTDKMDPITSYVDISNLEKVTIFSGQNGNENGQTIGGAIDLKLDKGIFTKYYNKLITGIDLGYESNSNTKIIGADVNYTNKKFYLNTDFIQRTAGNYSDGKNNEVLFSQYKKYNFSANAGYKISDKETLKATIIYDKATDVGYPALPMDVSLAEAIIASTSYEYSNTKSFINHFETKLYANTIKHVMDDTKRPNVPIHMDMPGWSDTYGFYAKVKAVKNKHNYSFNFNGYYNKSLAEMTMYPANSSEKLMFMLTWPDVRTLYSGIYLNDKIVINKKTTAELSTRIGFQNNRIASSFGLGSLQIFYPDLTPSKNRILPSITASISHENKNFTYTTSLGYGERAPSVSEGYGNFLYNSFDNFDYIGNPYLKNEKSYEFNSKINYKNKSLSIALNNSLFYIKDYIIGEINNNYEPMVIGANGVKVYTSLNGALMYNSSLSANFKLNNSINLNGSLVYSFGEEINGENLPLIAPISYKANIIYKKGYFNSKIEVVGAGTQHNFSKIYGEDKTENYTLLNIDAGYKFYMNSNFLILKTGVENLFNTYYSTYSDWNNIPRMGRNIFVNLSYVFK